MRYSSAGPLPELPGATRVTRSQASAIRCVGRSFRSIHRAMAVGMTNAKPMTTAATSVHNHASLSLYFRVLPNQRRWFHYRFSIPIEPTKKLLRWLTSSTHISALWPLMYFSSVNYQRQVETGISILVNNKLPLSCVCSREQNEHAPDPLTKDGDEGSRWIIWCDRTLTPLSPTIKVLIERLNKEKTRVPGR